MGSVCVSHPNALVDDFGFQVFDGCGCARVPSVRGGDSGFLGVQSGPTEHDAQFVFLELTVTSVVLPVSLRAVVAVHGNSTVPNWDAGLYGVGDVHGVLFA